MEAYADRIDYPVRKLAHMTEYGILLSLIHILCTSKNGGAFIFQKHF